MLNHFRSFIRSVSRRNELERDMEDEMRFHRQTFEDDLIASGKSRTEARRRARLEFGSIEAAKEECREAKGLSMLDEIMRNVRYASRLLRRAPGFAASVIGTLALCIGVNTAIFSIVDAILFRPLPYPEPHRLAMVVLQAMRGNESTSQQNQDGYTWEALKRSQSFELAASGGGFTGVNLGSGDRAVYIHQHRVSTGYFQVLGVPLIAGREFSEAEDRSGGPQAVILSYGLWKRLFYGDMSIVGRPILLRGEPHTVVGIARDSFQAMIPADLWTPLRPSTLGEGGGQNYTLVARLLPNVTWAEAQSEAQALGVSAVERLRIPADISARMNLLPLQDAISAGWRERILMVWAAVGVVLLIGCVNVASLMLARGAARSRELGTRIALGGGASSLVRQLIVEAVILGMFGCATGVAVGYFIVEGFQSVAEQFGVWQAVRLDERVLGCTILLSLVTSILFGLAPALQATRVDVRTALSEGGSRGVAGSNSRWYRRVLVVAEVSLGLVLLVSAGLLVRTLIHLQRLTPGFDGSSVLSASISLQDARYRSAESVNRLYRQTLDRIRQTPGVEAAAVGLHVPYQRWLQAGVDILGRSVPLEERGMPMTTMNYVSPDYFTALRIPLRAGRVIDERDTEKALPVVVINEAFARQYMQEQQALGAEIRVRMDGTNRQVIGIVGDVRQRLGFGRYGPLDYIPSIYVPVTQLPDQNFQLIHTWFSPNWVVRGRAVAALAQSVQRAVDSADPLLPIARFRTLEEEKGRALGSQRVNAILLGSLAGLALILAAVGIYGLIANSVVERTRELGIRLALGASVQRAIWTAIKPGVILTALGVLIGTILALMTTQLVKNWVYGIKTLDPLTFVVVAAILFATGAIASIIPTLRLFRMNPAQTLRQD